MTMRILLAFVAALIAAPLSAQDPVAALEKARAEVNAVENAADRAVYACARNQQPKCTDEARAAANGASRALYAVDQALAAVKPHDHAPPPVVAIPSPSLSGAPDWTAPFPLEQGLRPTSGIGLIPGVYSATDGAFRFVCGGDGPLAYDDPIVHPRAPGRSHGHLVWGSREFDAFTDGAALAAEARTNCNATEHSLNRSSYWMPWVEFIAGPNAGKVLRPDSVTNYYKRGKPDSPQCTPGSGRMMGTCVDLPNELRIVAGWDMLKPTEPSARMSWYCSTSGNRHWPNLDDLFAAGCAPGAILVANVILPYCWDGKNLDVPDHRSHMAYPSYGSWGYARCPPTHPFVIPTTEYKAMFTVRADMVRVEGGVARSNIRLSSDAMNPGAKPGSTLHADYFEKWDARAKALWHRNCIDKGLSGSGGDLCNGQTLIGAGQPPYGWTLPQPVVARPDGGSR